MKISVRTALSTAEPSKAETRQEVARQAGCGAESCPVKRVDLDSVDDSDGKITLDVYVDDDEAQTTRRLRVEIDSESFPAMKKFRAQLKKLRAKMEKASDVIEEVASSVKKRKATIDPIGYA